MRWSFFIMEQILRSACLSHEGVELVRYRIEFPDFGETAAGLFYKELMDRVCAFCEGALLARLREEYEDSDDPKKRFRFGAASYQLSGRLTCIQTDLWSVRMELLLRRRGVSAPVAAYRDGQIWQADSDGVLWLLSPEEAARQFGERSLTRKERRRATGAWLEERRVVLLESGRSYEIGRIAKKL